MATSCVPPDPFWNANRALAELLWQQHDGATVSTRIAEGVSATTRAPVRSTKTGLHGVASTAVGVAVAKASGSSILGMLVGLGVFVYLERDRC